MRPRFPRSNRSSAKWLIIWFVPPRLPKSFIHRERPHDQWLGALRSLDGVIDSSSSEMAKLADQTREWRRPIMISAAAPFRLCFRLEEPDKSPDWRVRYLLQASDDPSLLVPVADAWKAKGRVAAALKRGKFDPREYLLSTLGQAAGLSPHIERSSKSGCAGRLRSRRHWRARFFDGEGVDVGAGWLRRDAARVVDAQGNQAAFEHARECQKARSCKAEAAFRSIR